MLLSCHFFVLDAGEKGTEHVELIARAHVDCVMCMWNVDGGRTNQGKIRQGRTRRELATSTNGACSPAPTEVSGNVCLLDGKTCLNAHTCKKGSGALENIVGWREIISWKSYAIAQR
jgi:hypothetical protein